MKMTDGVHKNNEKQWPQDGALRYSRGYTEVIRGETVKYNLLTSDSEVICKPLQEGTRDANVL